MLLALDAVQLATRSVPGLLNESSTPPSNVFHDNAASTLTSCLSTASFFTDLHHGGFCLGGSSKDGTTLFVSVISVSNGLSYGHTRSKNGCSREYQFV
jgi:hypothetical protein